MAVSPSRERLQLLWVKLWVRASRAWREEVRKLSYLWSLSEQRGRLIGVIIHQLGTLAKQSWKAEGQDEIPLYPVPLYFSSLEAVSEMVGLWRWRVTTHPGRRNFRMLMSQNHKGFQLLFVAGRCCSRICLPQLSTEWRNLAKQLS